MQIDNAWKVLTGETESDKMMAVTVNIVGTLLKIARVLIGMALVIASVRFISYLVTKTLYRNSATGEISSLLKTVLSVIIYIVAFFIIFQSQFPGVELTALFTGSTIVGIVVGLALQDTLGNLFAGLALQADQPFQVGDVGVFVHVQRHIIACGARKGVAHESEADESDTIHVRLIL